MYKNILLELLTPLAAHADSPSSSVQKLIVSLSEKLINPALQFLFALALVLFVYGLVIFLVNRSEGGDGGMLAFFKQDGPKASSMDTGKKHMFYGVVGMFIMFSAFSILKIMADSLDGVNVSMTILGIA